MDRGNQAPPSFQGRVLIAGEVQAVTGLHVGGSAGALSIGNVDNPVVRNPLNGQPYLPGSSIRGKMRSLAEKFDQRRTEYFISRTRGKEVRIHVCENDADYQNCSVCKIFGIPGNYGFKEATRQQERVPAGSVFSPLDRKSVV